jgi:hypothetical protein
MTPFPERFTPHTASQAAGAFGFILTGLLTERLRCKSAQYRIASPRPR